jgi:hypothetical protein
MGRKKLTDKELHFSDNELAEKCRKALEKSYGASIPMPKYMTKTLSTQKRAIRKRHNNGGFCVKSL